MKFYLIFLLSITFNITFSQFEILSYSLIKFPEEEYECKIYDISHPNIDLFIKMFVSNKSKVYFEFYPLQLNGSLEFTKYEYDTFENLVSIISKDSCCALDSSSKSLFSNFYFDNYSNQIKSSDNFSKYYQTNKEHSKNIIYKYDSKKNLIQITDSCTGIRFNRIFRFNPPNYFENKFYCDRKIKYNYTDDELLSIVDSFGNEIIFCYTLKDYSKNIDKYKESNFILLNKNQNPVRAYTSDIKLNHLIKYNSRKLIKKIKLYTEKSKGIQTLIFKWKKIN